MMTDSENFSLRGGKLIWTVRNTECEAYAVLIESPPFSYLTATWHLWFGSGLDFESHACNYGVGLSKDSEKNAVVPFTITYTVHNNEMQTIHHDTVHITGADGEVEFFGWDADETCDFKEEEVFIIMFEFHCSIKASYPVLQISNEDTGEFSRLGHPCIDNFIEDMKGLLLDSSLYDVELKCKDGSVKAHKNILSARSKVFAAMLKYDTMLSGTDESRTEVIQIPDMNVEDCKKFLHYVYTASSPDLAMEDAHVLYEASDQYAVLGLKRQCAEFMSSNFSTENVCDILVIADLHSDKDFKEKAINYIIEEKVHLKPEVWTLFHEKHPDLASEVLLAAQPPLPTTKRPVKRRRRRRV